MIDSCECCDKHHLKLPESNLCLYPGNTVLFGRFTAQRWVVQYGWFAFGGNRKICGWYCYKEQDRRQVKPISDIDLFDVYLVEG